MEHWYITVKYGGSGFLSGVPVSVQKVPDLHSWRKIGRLETALGTEYDLFESPDGNRVAQVDDQLVIYMILEKGELVYMNPRTKDSLNRMKEINRFLKVNARRVDR